MAQRLVLSGATVKTHINRSFAKTGVRDRAQAVAYEYKTGRAKPSNDVLAGVPARAHRALLGVPLSATAGCR
jgi:hypothetical protein